MPYEFNILGASEKELIVMCLEKLEKIEEMLKVPTAKDAQEQEKKAEKEIITKTPTKKG